GIAMAGVGATYVPFLLAGHVATAAHVWRVAVPSAVSLAAAPGSAYGSSARVVQMAAALIAGAAVGRQRQSQQRPAAAPVIAVAVAVRLITDPYPQSYYVAPLLMAVTLMIVSEPGTGPRRLHAAGAVFALDLAFAAPGLPG